MKKTNILGLSLLSSVMLLGSCGGSSEVDYQYNTYMAGSPSTWNVHTWQTNDDSVIIAYTETGLYDFVLNEARDGYSIISEMADGEPIDTANDTDESNDLTDSEIDQYAMNAEEGASGFKWIVNLNPDACWEDGTPINADTYIYSMQQLLNPDMQNYRATSYYQDTLQIGNAEAYFKSGRKTFEQYSKYSGEDGYEDAPRYYSFNEYNALIASVSTAKEYTSIVEYMDDNLIPRFEEGLKGGNNDDSLIKIFSPFVTFERVQKTDGDGFSYLGIEKITVSDTQKGYKLYDRNCETAFQILGAMFAKQANQDGINAAIDNLTYIRYEWPKIPWENVGLVKSGEYQLTFYLKTEIEEYYFKYNLSGNWLVYEPLYEAGKSQNGSLTITNYATRQDNYKAYGPYKLTHYQIGKSIILERNENWYGYKDGKHNGQYQTTRVKFDIITEHSVALQKFLKGDLDDISLTADDMKTYGNSSRLYKTQTTYSQKLTFNTDFDVLKKRQSAGVNKTVLANHDFREAFSYAMNRQKFAAEYTSGHVPSTVLLNSQYISDYNNNEVYRNTEQGKRVSTDIYGDIANGYSVKVAKELFQRAYETETQSSKDGHLLTTDKVVIQMLLYNTDSEASKAQILFIRECLAEATAGTGFEGKIEFTTRKDEDYYNTAYEGNFDCIWSIWGGMTMDPFGFMQVYTAEATKVEYGFHPESEMLTIDPQYLEEGINVENGENTMTYDGWRQAIASGGKYAKLEKTDKENGHKIRLNILSELEKAIITRYETICFTSRAEAELLSYKVEFGCQDDLPLVGRGGMRELTYNCTASEWAKIKKNLDYKA